MRLHSMNRRSVQLGCFLAGALSVAIVVVFIASFHEVLCWKTPWDSYKDVTIVPVQSSLSLHPSTITMPKTTDPTVSSITPQEAIHNSEEHYGFPSSIGVEDWNDSCTYTIVIQTYKRNDILHRVLTHYCTFCEAHKILVVWNNVGQRVPKDLSIQADSCCPTLIFLEQKVNTIRNRFYPYPEIQTEAVLSLDDDLIINKRDVKFGCRVWKKWKHLIVGWLPRVHEQSFDGNTTRYTYFRALSKGRFARYSMVLTGEAFMHISYLKLFTNALPEEAKQMIDNLQNCEDIAMNVMVADVLARSGHPQCSGLRLQASSRIRNLEKQSKLGFKGLWRRPDAKDNRGHCLEKLAQIYTSLPLRYSDMMIAPNSFH